MYRQSVGKYRCSGAFRHVTKLVNTLTYIGNRINKLGTTTE